MKTSNVGTKRMTSKSGSWESTIGGCTPPQSRVQLLPTNMNKSFLVRLKEWLK